VVAGCCDKATHVLQRGEPGFKEKLASRLEDLKINLKDFLFYERRKNFQVIEPNVDLLGLLEDAHHLLQNRRGTDETEQHG
jgi:hypothetical protein